MRSGRTLFVICLLTMAMLIGHASFAAVPGCASAAPWKPVSTHQAAYYPEQPQSDVTVIIMHGKGGSMYASFFDPLRERLLKLGYNVILAHMTWSHFWDGTQCQGLNYLQQLVKAEKQKGMRVLLVGHSLGGMHSLIYAHFKNHGLTGVIPVAPGHMLPLSKRVIETTQGDIDRAKRLIRQGKGNKVFTFKTLNGYALQDVVTTPRIYLSYHDPNQTWDFNQVLPSVKPRWLWIVGANDGIKAFNDKTAALMPGNVAANYKVTAGDDHFTVLDKVANLVHKWFTSWSKIGPRPRYRENPHLFQLLDPVLMPD